jgi:hypothetical protein
VGSPNGATPIRPLATGSTSSANDTSSSCGSAGDALQGYKILMASSRHFSTGSATNWTRGLRRLCAKKEASAGGGREAWGGAGWGGGWDGMGGWGHETGCVEAMSHRSGWWGKIECASASPQPALCPVRHDPAFSHKCTKV